MQKKTPRQPAQIQSGAMRVLSTFLVIVAMVASLGVWYFVGEALAKDKDPHTAVVISEGDFTVHFLELGNRFAGDAVYINYGDICILIDAGSRQDSAAVIIDYVNQHSADAVLNYVIVTHAHQDHIAGFVSSGSGRNFRPGVFDAFEVETIIDYSRTNSTSAIRNQYETARNRLIQNGTTHHSALHCASPLFSAPKLFKLSEDAEIEILYNYFYENPSSSENNFSVCVMIRKGGRQFLFTGDMESAGESRLVAHYNLGNVTVFHGGHHGSSTSNTTTLLNAIKPEIVVFTTVAGSTQYTQIAANTFPTQAVIDRIAPHTDRVYVTSAINSRGNLTSLNGHVTIIVCPKNEVSVHCSVLNQVLKDTWWFSQNRTTPQEWAF
jgi:competence protein ComEC